MVWQLQSSLSSNAEAAVNERYFFQSSKGYEDRGTATTRKPLLLTRTSGLALKR